MTDADQNADQNAPDKNALPKYGEHYASTEQGLKKDPTNVDAVEKPTRATNPGYSKGAAKIHPSVTAAGQAAEHAPDAATLPKLDRDRGYEPPAAPDASGY